MSSSAASSAPTTARSSPTSTGKLLLNEQGEVAYPMPLESPGNRGRYATVIDGDRPWYAGEEHITIARATDTWDIEGGVFTGLRGAHDDTPWTRRWPTGGFRLERSDGTATTSGPTPDLERRSRRRLRGLDRLPVGRPRPRRHGPGLWTLL